MFTKNTIRLFINTYLLRLNLLAQNQVLRCNKVLFALLIVSLIGFSCRKILVSSANNVMEALGAQFAISFTYTRNNKGPNTFHYQSKVYDLTDCGNYRTLSRELCQQDSLVDNNEYNKK